MAKLLTHHDPNHIHAFFGALTLIHFFYRFSLMLMDVENCGFGRDIREDIFCMLLMPLPNITSFLFTIVPVLKGKDGFTIWREYRWHATIFTFRSWFFLTILLYTKHFQPEGLVYMKAYRVILVFTTMVCAQIATKSYPPQASTIRGMYASTWSSTAAGFLQFMGTSVFLCGAPTDEISIHYLSIIVIQLNAFNMTLRKKRKVGARTAQACYSIMLGSSAYLFGIRRFMEIPPSGLFDYRLKTIYMAVISYCFRRFLRYNRFLAWSVGMAAFAMMPNDRLMSVLE